MIELEDILMDEQKVNAAMKVISNNEIKERMEESVEALKPKTPVTEGYTDYDELD